MFKFLSRLGDSNEREVRALQPIVEGINALEPEIQARSDDELRAGTDALRTRLRERVGDVLTPIELRETDPDADASESALAGADAARLADQLKQQRERELAEINEALEEVLPEAFAAVREAMVRALGKRHYDVQLMGGIVLHRGPSPSRHRRGQDLVAPLAAYLNALVGRGVHVVTPNDYLAKRDAQWIGPIFHRLGHERRLDPARRRVPVRPRLSRHRRAAARPSTRLASRGLRGRHHLRHEQRVRVRLPARQHGGRPDGACRPA